MPLLSTFESPYEDSRKRQAQKAREDASAAAAAYAAAMAKKQAQAVNIDALSIEAQAQAAQAVEAYAEGMATPQQVEAAIDTAAAVEQEKTRNALVNVGLPLTFAVGLFIFFFKGKK